MFIPLLPFLFLFYSVSFHCSLCFMYVPAFEEENEKKKLQNKPTVLISLYLHTHTWVCTVLAHIRSSQWNGMASFNLMVMRQATKRRLQMIWWRRCLWWWNLRPSTSKHKTLINLLFSRKKTQVRRWFVAHFSTVWSHYYSLPLVM